MLGHHAERTRYVSLAEVADYLGVSIKTVRRRVAEGQIPAYRVGRLLKVDVADVEQLLRRVPTT
jgi:excisionase family DNA binding protein